MDGELLAVLKWTAVYTGFTFLCTAAGAAAVFFLKPDAKTELAETLSLGFAAGIMTAASVWSLIIPLKSSKAPTNYFTPNILRKSWSRLVVSVVHLDALAFPVAAT